jgi:hypothetical protein
MPLRAVAPAAILLSAVLWSAATACGQQPNPHDGEWSLEFRVATRPGGVTRVASRGLTPEDMQTVNLLVQISRPSFTVAADGAVRWEQREGGRVQCNDFSTAAGKSNLSDCQAVLRVQGKATATPAPEGSRHSYDRKLMLEMAWAGGSGRGQDHGGVPFTVRLSADGSEWITNYGAARVEYEHSIWALEPATWA